MKNQIIGFNKNVLSLLLLIILVLKSNCCISQNNLKLDSLKNKYSLSLHDTIKFKNLLEQADILIYENTYLADSIIQLLIYETGKIDDLIYLVKSYNKKGELFFRKGKYEKAINQLEESISLGEKIDFKDGVSEALIWMGNVYQRQGNYKKAEELQLANIEICKEINDLNGIASSNNNIANIYLDQGFHSIALEKYTIAYDLYDKINHNQGKVKVITNMGIVQNMLGNYDKAIDYFNQSIEINRKMERIEDLHFTLKNLGISYKKKKEYDKALLTYNKALKYFEKLEEDYQVYALNINIGNVYWEKGNFKRARNHYNKAMTISIAIGDTTSIGWTNISIGTTYSLEGKYEKALTYFLNAKKIALKLNHPLLKMDVEYELSENYLKLNAYKKAYNSYSNYIFIRDSLQGIEKVKLTEELDAKFQNEKKEKEISQLNAQNEINTLQIRQRENERNYLIVILIVGVILLLVLLNQNKIKNKANRKLNELNKLQSSFFTNISHEFRTPLTLILSAIDQDKGEIECVNIKNHNIVKKNANRLLQLINQLLDLSKLEAGSEKLRVSKTNVSDFMKNLVNSFSSWADSKSIIFNIEISNSDINGFLDTDKIQKIVYNLLSNSFKFTPEKGEITFRSVINEKQFSFEIFDNGIGMSKKALDNIFQKFYQVDSADNRGFEGSGIGLAITKELIELHKGNIFVSSEEKVGTSFLVTIPLRGYNRNEIKEDAKETAMNLQELPLSNITKNNPISKDQLLGTKDFVILLVEDNPDLLEYLNENLDEHYKILKAYDGEQGYKMALDNIPDLIISDLMMPRLDGKEMSKKIRENEKTTHIPIIMLTAKADEESKIEGLEVGADDYLTKPFDFKELKIKIRNILLQRNKIHEHIKNEFFFPNPKLTANDKFIKKASTLVEENISNAEFTVNDFQKEMGYSRMQLHRKIKAITGHSVNEFIRLTRLKKAALLLEKGYDQISQIAYETGFNSPSYFAKCFKEVYGVTPKEYVENKK